MPKTLLDASLTALSILLFATVFARLGGLGATVLPSALFLTAFAVASLVVRRAVLNRPALPTTIRHDWRGLLARHGFSLGLAGLVLLALLVRLPSIGADLGHQPLDIDEHRVAANVKAFFVKGELGHRTVEHYPGLLFWVLTGASLMLYLHGLMEGAFFSIRSMPVETFVFAGRLVSALIASGIVVVVGLIGRQLSGQAAGLLAALLLAVVPLSVQTTTVLRNDPAQVLLVCAAVHASLAAASTNRRLWFVLAGLFGGAATAIKYTSVFALLPAAIASLRSGSASLRAARLGLVLLAFALTVAITNHFLWWDFPNFVEQLSDQIGITGPGHWAAVQNPAAFHTGILARFGVGWVLLILAGGYGAYGLATGRRHAWVFWTFALLYSWFATKRPSQFPRWVFPLLPFVAVAGAVALVALLSRLRAWSGWADRRRGPALRAAATAAVLVVALSQPLWMGLVTASRAFVPQTHHLVEDWLRGRPAGARVLTGDKWLDLEGSTAKVRRVADLGAALQGSVYQLAASDWIVVPEPLFSNPGVKQLTMATRISADHWRFGGTPGYDFQIFAAPRLPVAAGPIEIRFDDAAAAQYLSDEWGASGARPDRLLPARGASVFLPPRESTTANVTVDIVAGGPVPGLSITDDKGEVTLVAAPAQDASRRSLSGVAHLAPGGRATELRLSPATRNSRVRVLRVLVD